MGSQKERAANRVDGEREVWVESPGRLSRRTLLRRTGRASARFLSRDPGRSGIGRYDQGVLAAGDGPAYAPWSNWREQKGLLRLVGTAILAPSPHNAQAWLLRVGKVSGPHRALAHGVGATPVYSPGESESLACVTREEMLSLPLHPGRRDRRAG